MNKKLIIIISVCVVALVGIIAAAIGISSSINVKDNGDDKTSGSSSVVSGSEDKDSQSGDKDTTSESGKTDSDTPHVNAEKDDAKTGDIVDVPIKVTKNPGMGAGEFVFEYDSNVFEFVDYEEGNILDEYDVNATGGKVKCIISHSKLEDVSKTGTLIVLQFKVKSGAKKGDYTVKYSKESQVANFDEQYVEPAVADGKITVK